MKRILIYLILAAFFTGAVIAQDVSVRSDHPDEYTVQDGDTLWDISGRFLDYPWQWPAIWHANQQIENPHLIYPGDVVSLAYIDGVPRLMVDRGKPVVKLGPNVRSTSREAVSAIPLEDIYGFLNKLRMFSEEEYNRLPYVVGNFEDRVNALVSDRTYVMGLTGELGQRFAVVRLAHIYFRDGEEKRAGFDPGYGNYAPLDEQYRLNRKHRWINRGEVLGLEFFEVAIVKLVKHGEPAILDIVESQMEVQRGDMIVPLDSGFPEYFMPRAMDVVPEGIKVLAVQGDNNLVGHQKIVSVSAGTRQGVEPGQVFSAFRPGSVVRDEHKYPAGSWSDFKTLKDDKVVLPSEFQAYIMIFRTFDEISYALVMEGPSEVRVNDILRHPDETL